MELRGGDLFIAVVTLCILLADGSDAFSDAISGRRAPCGNEGERVAVDHIDKHKCFSCICKNGFVECKNDYYCPPTEGCYMLVEKTDDGCCQKCKGCIYRGVYHESHTEWSDPAEPCRVMRCEAGIVTESDLQCHTPCSNPLPPAPGTCCPTCPECKINGQVVTDDRDVTSDDPCLKCRCSANGMLCSKKACPVLQCPEEHQRQIPGECCPRCSGTRTLFTLPNTCVLQKKLLNEGQTFSIDRCTSCTCRNESSVCKRNTCPILNCSPALQMKIKGSCCKQCSEPEEVRTQCSYGGQIYQDGQSWQLDECSSCKCIGGMQSCARTRCNITLPCPPGFRLVHTPGECCQKCEEVEGVCMAFGDPHYKTFDGKIYSFQGYGKYQLVTDCHSRSFSIRVGNGYPSNRKRKAYKSSTITKRVTVIVGQNRINLGQNYTKVNRRDVSLPYKVEGKLIAEVNEDNVVVTLYNGVKVLWSGKSFVEVSVPSSFKNKLCGLCGNFNSDVQDDFRLKNNQIVSDTEVLQFGNAWCVGNRERCKKQLRATKQIKPCKYHQKPVTNPCKYLKSTNLFNGCDSKLNYSKYYKACMMDMCDCPGRKCYCESLTAYARECERLGVNVINWQKNAYCAHSEIQKHKPQKTTPHPLAVQYFRAGKNKDRRRIPLPLID